MTIGVGDENSNGGVSPFGNGNWWNVLSDLFYPMRQSAYDAVFMTVRNCVQNLAPIFFSTATSFISF